VHKLLLIGGGVNLLWGVVTTMTTEGCWHNDICWDQGEDNIPRGMAIIVASVVMIVAAFRRTQDDSQLFICPNCELVRPFVEVQTKTCLTCGVKLEPLDGFYERHPELKNND